MTVICAFALRPPPRSVAQSAPATGNFEINGKLYETLAKAVAAANAGDTIKMLADETSDALTIAKAITLDLGGFDIAATGELTLGANVTITNGAYNISGANVVITNGVVTLAADAELNGTTVEWVNVNGGTLNVYGKIYSTDDYGSAIVIRNEAVLNTFDGCVVNGGGYTFKPKAEADGLTSTININGGTLIYRCNAPGNSYCSFYGSKTAGGCNITITGGTFDSPSGIFGMKDNYVVAALDDTCTAKFQAANVKPSSASKSFGEYCAAGYGPVKVDDTYYTIQKLYDITITTPENGTLETSVTNNIAAGTPVTVTATADTGFELESITTNGTAITGTTFVMPAEDVTVAATFKKAAPLFPVDDDSKVTPEGKENEATAIEVFGDGLAEYIATVYGEGGKIPYEKINGTSADLIKIAKAYELPIMTEPEVEIEKAAEGDGFTFQIVDDGTPVAMQAEKVLSMVQFTADLGVAFDAATTDNVEVALSTDKKTATATFTKATNAGFMMVKLAVPTTAE